MLGWDLVKNRNGVDFWKTPTRYLVCKKYEGYFHFFDSFNEAEYFYNEAIKGKWN